MKLIVKLNHVVNPVHAIANDIKYYLPCWVKLQRRGLTSNNDTVDENKTQEIENCSQIAVDLDLIKLSHTNLLVLQRSC